MALVVLALPIPADMLDFFALVIKAAVGASVYMFVAFVFNVAGCRKIIAGLVEKLRESRSQRPSSELVEAAE